MKYVKMTKAEKEIAGLTGMWQGTHLSEVNPLSIVDRQEIADFLTVVNLYNAEVLEDMYDTTVARRLLKEIGIECDEHPRDPWC